YAWYRLTTSRACSQLESLEAIGSVKKRSNGSSSRQHIFSKLLRAGSVRPASHDSTVFWWISTARPRRLSFPSAKSFRQVRRLILSASPDSDRSILDDRTSRVATSSAGDRAQFESAASP